MGKDFFTKFYIVIVCLFLLFYAYLNILQINQKQGTDMVFYKISIVLVLVSVYSYLSLRLVRLFFLDSILSKIFGFWYIALLLEGVLIDTGLGFSINLTNSIIMLIPISIYFYFYLVFNKVDILHFYLKIAVLFTIALAFIYYKEYNIMNMLVIKKHASLLIAYYPLLMLPTALLLNNKYLRLFIVLLIAVIVFSSMKRGGLIALSLSLITYYFIEYIIIRGNRFMIIRLVYVVLVLLIFSLVFYYFDRYNNGFFLHRLETINTDQGSGRLPLYRKVFILIENSSFFEILFGHGENAVFRYNHKLSAHNDFLEVLFDYGIIVFIGYVFLHFQLIKNSIRFIKQKSHFAAPFSVSYILFIVLSLISHVIIYPYFFMLTAFWGMVLGITNRESKMKIQQSFM